MKNLIYILFLALFISSCSSKLSDIQRSKVDYVKSAIICDSKTTKFTILNQEELVEFFDSEETGKIGVKYEYGKLKTKIKRGVVIIRANTNGKITYRAYFKRYAFPMSDCRKLETEPKVF